MVSGATGAIDADDGTPESHAAPASSGPDRLDHDEFGLDYVPGASGAESSFSTDDFPG